MFDLPNKQRWACPLARVGGGVEEAAGVFQAQDEASARSTRYLGVLESWSAVAIASSSPKPARTAAHDAPVSSSTCATKCMPTRLADVCRTRNVYVGASREICRRRFESSRRTRCECVKTRAAHTSRCIKVSVARSRVGRSLEKLF